MNLLENKQFAGPMAALREELQARIGEITDDDRAELAHLSDKGQPSRKVTMQPRMAGIVATVANLHNRDLSIPKVKDYQRYMEQGEWQWNHQGIAFAPDGSLVDGQHRLLACCLADKAIEVQVTPNTPKSAVMTIDVAKPRNAGDALQLNGIENAKEKAAIGKMAMDYMNREEHGVSLNLSVIEIERWVTEHDLLCGTALEIGHGSVRNVSQPCLNAKEAATYGLLMLLGGWKRPYVEAFVSRVQLGYGSSESEPTFRLSSQLAKARNAENKRNRMTPLEKMASFLKVAKLWAEDVHNVSGQVTWKKNKEVLPTHKAPEKFKVRIDRSGDFEADEAA